MSQSGYHSLGRSSHQIIRDGSFATKKQFIQNQLFHHHIVEHNMVIQGLLKKLHATLIHEKVPDFYGYFFMGQLTLCSQDRISESITRQIQQLKSKQSSFHLIMKYIGVREACLKSISSCIDSLFEEMKPGMMDRLTEEIKHLRELTVLVIEEIKRWKNSLINLSQTIFENEHLSFFYLNQDYLLKILRDTDFISKSFLSEKVTFSQKQDPFLMRPYTQNQSSQFVSIFAFSQEQKNKYIICLQFLADERADYVKRKMTAKADRIKEIERAYQTNQLNEKILITKVNPLALKKAKPSISQIPIDFIDENPKQDTKRLVRSQSRSEMRQSRNKELQIKGQKIKKIKEMDLGPSPLINITKFNSLIPNAVPITRSVSLGFIKKKSSQIIKMDSQKEAETDFETLMRKKELQVMQNDNIKRKTLSTIRLKDRLSQRKLIDNKEGAQQLRKILDQIQHSSPQREESFFIRRETPSRMGKSLIQQNQEIMVNLRESILKEISDETYTKQKIEQQRREQNNFLDKIVKMKLDQQTLKDIQKTKNAWIDGKDILASDLNKKELFGYQDPSPKKTEKLIQLQSELKREMQLKFLREVHEQLSHRQAVSKHQQLKKREDQVRQKQMQVVNRKKEQEVRFQQIEKEQRSKMTQEELRKDENRRKQIQMDMQAVIERQQEKLIQYSNEQKMKLQSQLRQNMKQKLLANLRKEKSVVMSQKEAQQKRRKIQQSHRAQVRKKMEEEFEIEKNIERQRQRQEKNRKLRLLAQKMDHIHEQVSQSKLVREESLKQSRMEELRSSINKIPNMSSKAQQQTKKKLRQEFQLQLFAFNRPQNFKVQQDNFVIKDYKNQIDNEDNLNRKLERQQQAESQQAQLKEQLPTFKQKESSLKASKLQPSQLSEKFERFSEAFEEGNSKKSKQRQPSLNQEQLKKMGINMTPEQYTIYKKKKDLLDSKRINPPKMPEIELKKVKVILEDFQKMSNLDSQKPEIEQIKQEESRVITPFQDRPLILKQQTPQPSPKIKLQNESQDLSDVMKLTVHSKMGSVHKKKFITSDEDDSEPRERRNKKKAKNQKQIKAVDSPDEKEKSFDKPKPKHQNALFRRVAIENLDQYLSDHFKKLPKLIRKLNLLKKDELLKSFDDYKSLMIVQVSKQQEVEGIVFAVENENKQNIRSLNMVHLGAYKQQETINVLIKSRDLLFAQDPCSEITFSTYYNKEDEDQSSFIKQFQKQFDPYGAIFQKKISNSQIERKHVLRRMIGEEALPLASNKTIGQLKIYQNMLSYSTQYSLGVDLQLQKTGKELGSWTLLCLFLSNYCKQEQIVKQLTSDVQHQKKNIKHLSKMVMKLKNSKFSDIEYQTFQNPFQTNLRLIELNKPLIKCDPQKQQTNIPVIITNSTIAINFTLPFVSTSANFYYKGNQQIGKYLRLKCGKGSRVLKLKSSLYSSTLTVLPCKPGNYKILLTDALQFDSISSTTSIDLYIKLFLANITQHSQSSDEFIWIPQCSAQTTNKVEYCEQFGFNNELRNKIDLSYTEYVPNCIDFKPTHRDLFITPPYILAVLNSDIQKVIEGSPIYIQRMDMKDLVGVSAVPTPPPQSDF